MPEFTKASLEDQLERWLATKSPVTQRNYRGDLRLLAEFFNHASTLDCLWELFREAPETADDRIEEWIHSYDSPANRNRRLACIKSLSKRLHQKHLINWVIGVDSERPGNVTNVQGPPPERLHEAMAAIDLEPDDYIRTRDRAIMLCIILLARRRKEIVALDMEDYDPEARCLMFRVKKHRNKQPWYLLDAHAEAINAWLKLRSGHPRWALFTSVNGKRLHDNEILRITQKYAQATPNGLRHTVITQLDVERAAMGMSDRQMMKLTGHDDEKSLNKYTDHGPEVQLHLAGALARRIGVA